MSFDEYREHPSTHDAYGGSDAIDDGATAAHATTAGEPTAGATAARATTASGPTARATTARATTASEPTARATTASEPTARATATRATATRKSATRKSATRKSATRAVSDRSTTRAAGQRLREAAALGAGTALADALLGINAHALSADEVVTYAQEWERVAAFVLACREQARADANAVLVGHFRAEDARYAEADRITNEQRDAAGLAPIPVNLSAGRGSGFVPPELAALNELGAALRMPPRTIDAVIAHARDLAGPGPTTMCTPDGCAHTMCTPDGCAHTMCTPDGCAHTDCTPDGCAGCCCGGRLRAPWAPLLTAMRAGELSEQHVHAIARWLPLLPAGCDPTQRATYAQQCADVLRLVIPYARTHTPGEAGRRTKTLVLTADPAKARDRRRNDAENRHGVHLAPTEPGTCDLVATMPIAHGEAIMSAVSLLAKDARFETAAGCATPGQRQVAALVALILGDPGSVGRITGPVSETKIKAHISVVVPLATITTARKALTSAALARTEAGPFADAATSTAVDAAPDALPGGRIGVEPVPADFLRDVLADASTDSTIRRLVTDDVGTVIDIGRAHYTPTGLQQRLIRLRDGVCRFPGCTRRAEHCEIDHAVAWDAGGATDLANLGALCKHHHQMKTHGRWQITKSDRAGRCTWRSPLGRIYDHEPDPLVPDPLVPDPLVPASAVPDTDEPPF